MNTEHPRFGQRLQTGGGILLVAGVTGHLRDHLSILVAGCLLSVALLYRLSIELSIVGDETEEEIEPKLRHLRLLNQFSFLAAAFGLAGFLHEQ